MNDANMIAWAKRRIADGYPSSPSVLLSRRFLQLIARVAELERQLNPVENNQATFDG